MWKRSSSSSSTSTSTSSQPKATGCLGSMDQVRQVFDQYDKNGDGKISCDELREVLSALGPSPTTREEASAAMSEIDKDGDGFIDLDEFSELILGGGGGGGGGGGCGVKELRDAFDLYDLDGNGVISAGELHAVMKKLGQKCTLRDCRKMISSVDRDGDGNVNFEEFKKMMTTTTTSNGASS
ncbi:calcium-binding protein CML24-like [Syzygium oleosum]|uniref:calcium-binding protein CML24-like n=1 Tax=Syzygium oleosum TaxID=219896 RepID=UPI0011D22EEF|nr:calcium-binding protein CML24-like [Syzygium oleosum]